MPEKKNRTTSTAAQALILRSCLVNDPGLSLTELMDKLKIKQATLYSLLSALAADPELCREGLFPIRTENGDLTRGEVEIFLKNPDGGRVHPGISERLLYLYYHLHGSIPDGGLSMEELINKYRELISYNGRPTHADATLRRMIYRDLNGLEKMQIFIDRPASGSHRYCLREHYLPKLSADSAAAVYTTMLLYRDTLLDQPTTGARLQLEKAFFRNHPEHSGILRDRVHVVADTLAHPEEFGNNLGLLIRAVTESYRLSIEYVNISGQRSRRLLEPLGMVCKRNVWYLVANDSEKGDIRTFRVDQIAHISLREAEHFEYPPDFTLEEHIGASWGVYCNDPVQRVLLRFSPQVAARVKNLRYHHSQQIVEESHDGSLLVEFKACGLNEMQGWVLQWGAQVEVLEPEEFRKNMVSSLHEISGKYETPQKN